MAKYKHLYFDLDRTLWDFETNSFKALELLFKKYNLNNLFPDAREFIQTYHKHNERLWAQYREGNLTKAILRSKRFELTLKDKKLNDPELAAQIGEDYLSISVIQTSLFPGTHEILTYLKSKYRLYILTNGFKETQLKKLKYCDLEKYFERVFTSETIGYNKPDTRIFQWAVSSVNARKNECIMIGDDQLVDIKGAKSFGMDTVFFNPGNEKIEIEANYQVSGLLELKGIL